jgi:hypothetical protein
MSEELLMKLVPKLKTLDKGAYERGYRTGGSFVRTNSRQLISDLLRSLGVEFEEDVQVAKGGPRADFRVNGVFVFIEPRFSRAEQEQLRRTRARSVIIRRETMRSDREDHGFRVLGLGEEGKLQTIFLDDPSFNFDYAHILPKT